MRCGGKRRRKLEKGRGESRVRRVRGPSLAAFDRRIRRRRRLHKKRPAVIFNGDVPSTVRRSSSLVGIG